MNGAFVLTTNHRDEAAKYPNTVGIVAWVEVTACAAFAFFGNLRFGNSVMGIGFEDDFFYYLAIARNLAFQGRSTFDGTHLTNGYHPLWMVVVAALTKVFGSGGLLHAASDVPFAASFETLKFTMLLSISWCTLRAARAFCGPSVSITIQLLLTSFAIMMLRSGMEVGLTLALVFALLYWRVRPEFSWTSRRPFSTASLPVSLSSPAWTPRSWSLCFFCLTSFQRRSIPLADARGAWFFGVD